VEAIFVHDFLLGLFPGNTDKRSPYHEAIQIGVRLRIVILAGDKRHPGFFFVLHHRFVRGDYNGTRLYGKHRLLSCAWTMILSAYLSWFNKLTNGPGRPLER
jgi:hypothetical protein